jgi:hypothetical protein
MLLWCTESMPIASSRKRTVTPTRSGASTVGAKRKQVRKVLPPAEFLRKALGPQYAVFINNRTWIGKGLVIKPRNRSSVAELVLDIVVHDLSALPDERVQVGTRSIRMAEYVRLMLGTAAESKSVTVVIDTADKPRGNQLASRERVFSRLRSITAKEIHTQLQAAAAQTSIKAFSRTLGAVTLRYHRVERQKNARSSRFPALSNNEFFVRFRPSS